MIYLLDANFFIQSHRDNYPLDVVVSFWGKFKEISEKGIVISIDKIYNELNSDPKNPDALSQWCTNNLPKNFFKPTDGAIAQYQDVVGWAQSRSGHYTSAAITEFLSTTEADAFLVAYAMKYREVKIVTKESSNPNMKNRIKLPEPCDAFGIQYCNLITMFREINERF